MRGWLAGALVVTLGACGGGGDAPGAPDGDSDAATDAALPDSPPPGTCGPTPSGPWFGTPPPEGEVDPLLRRGARFFLAGAMIDTLSVGTDAGGRGIPTVYGDGAITLFAQTGPHAFAQVHVETDDDITLRPYALDFDGDGRLDVIAAAPDGSSLELHRALADGSFVASRLDTGRYPYDVAAADVDDDGKKDLIVAAAGLSAISVHHGHGDGTFDAPVHYSAGEGDELLHVADWDGDGMLDVATWNATSGDVSILHGAGDGSFTPSARLRGDGCMHRAYFGDFDGDGAPDVAALHQTGSAAIDVFRNDGHGSLSAVNRIDASLIQSVAVGDLDGDHRDDLVGAQSDGTFVLLSAPAVVGAAPRVVGGGVAANYVGGIVIADLDGDGARDLVFSEGFRLGVFYGDGHGGLGPAADIARSLDSGPVAAGDVDGDGLLDVVAAMAAQDETGARHAALVVGLLDGAGGVRSTSTFLSTGDAVDRIAPGLADVNHDGHLDAVLETSSFVEVALGGGDGTMHAGSEIPVENGLAGIALADFDLDGKIDLAYGDGTLGGLLVVARGDGAGGFATSTTFPITVLQMASCDLDGDGRPDLVVSDGATDGATSWIRANGSGFDAPVRIDSGESYYESAVTTCADVDGDAKLDVVQVSQDGDVRVLRAASRATAPVHTKLPSPMPRQIVALVTNDVDGDGHLDVVAADSQGISVVVATGNGDGTFSGLHVTALPSAPRALAKGDFDGDGRAEVLVAMNNGFAILHVVH